MENQADGPLTPVACISRAAESAPGVKTDSAYTTNRASGRQMIKAPTLFVLLQPVPLSTMKRAVLSVTLEGQDTTIPPSRGLGG
jgi:hypothetical protein